MLSPSYSCQGPKLTYEGPALFLTEHSRTRNAPELLFNGACRAPDYFQVLMAGDDMSVIADLGDGVEPEAVSAARAFNPSRIHDAADYSAFRRTATVRVGHTYAVLMSSSERRGLFVFRVLSLVPNRSVWLRYVVRAYVWQEPRERAPGFSWEATMPDAAPTPRTHLQGDGAPHP